MEQASGVLHLTFKRVILLYFLFILTNPLNAAVRSGARDGSIEHRQVQLDQMVGAPRSADNSQTTCQMNSKDLLSVAESTARAVQGICNSREIEDRLHNIESQMADQLNVVKTMLLNIEDKLSQQDNQYRRANRKLHGAMAELSESVNAQCGSSSDAEAVTSRQSQTPSSLNVKTPSRNVDAAAGIRSTGADPADDEQELFNPRQEEIDRFNSSILTENGKRVFSYYWKVGDIEYKLTSWGPRRSLRSPSFYIFEYGYMMYLRLYPRQNGANVYCHVGLTKGDYDEALEWPFQLKHRISIIDQSTPPYQDIVSRIWDPKILCSAWNWKQPVSGDNYECVGLGFPTEDLRGHNFIRSDSIFIKLTVYLD